MKHVSILVFFVLCCTFANAQDTIVKSNGDQISAKIIEVSPTEVKYKKFDFQEGPTFVESKSNIKLLKYSNGSMDEIKQVETVPIKTFESNTDYYSGPVLVNNKINRQGNHFQYKGDVIGERAMHDVLYNSKDKHIMLLVGNAKDAKILQYVGFGAIPFGYGALYFLTKDIGLNTPDSKNLTLSAICFLGAISCPIASGYFKRKRNTCNKEAIKLYNARY